MAEVILERKVCQEGEPVFKQGDRGECAYIIQSGEIEIVRTDDEVSTVLATVGEGGIFGEMALVDNAPRMATATAKVSTTVIIVSRAMFEAKLAKADPFIRRLMHIFVDIIRTTSRPEPE